MNTVSFALNLDDYNALTRNIEKKRNGAADWFVRWGSPVVAFVLGATPLFAQWPGSDPMPIFGGLLSPLTNAAFWLAVGLWSPVVYALARKRFRKTAHFGHQDQLILEEKGVRAQGLNGETLLFWPSILSVEETEDHIFLFLSDRQAFIAPKRAFASPTEAHNFAILAQHFWQEAHPTPAALPIATPN